MSLLYLFSPALRGKRKKPLSTFCSKKGTLAHKTIDTGQYSHDKQILQAMDVYSHRYGLFGKIDLFNIGTKSLWERKRHIQTVYPGYIFQLYAQYFCLKELGYSVQYLYLHSLCDNKTYPIALPENDPILFAQWKTLLQKIKKFSWDQRVPLNINKCRHCIYNQLCEKSLYPGEPLC